MFKDERMKVLQMLGDGKIDAEGAEELLLTLAKISHKGGDDQMKDERMKILQMLDDGKIEAEEAESLLMALAKTDCGHHRHWQPNIDIDKEKFNEKFQQFAESMDSFAKDFSCKAHEVYKDVEPKLKSAAKTVIEKTASLADEIAKNLQESIRKMEEEAAAKKQSHEGDCNCGCQNHSNSSVVYNRPDDENRN